MNNILEDVYDLKSLIEGSSEYKDYIKYLNILEDNKEIKKLINEITKKQKEIVRLETFKKNSEVLEKELDELFDELNSYPDYKEYINFSKKLNIIITEVQTNFQKYFNSLVS